MCNRSNRSLVRMKWSSLVMIVVLLSTWMTPVAVFAEPPEPVKAQAIAAGAGSHILVLKTDGTVVAWGYNSFGQTDVPAGLSGVKAIATGIYHSLALKTDGTVVGWGGNYRGQTNIPEGLNGVTAIAAGGDYSLALKSDGTVVAWGSNYYGERNVPAGLSGVKAMAAGRYHALALKTDGTVVAWGDNSFGQTDMPAGLGGVKAIKAGDYRSFALKTDGTVVGWGSISSGDTNVLTTLSNVIAIDSSSHWLILKSDGKVEAWGVNIDGQANVPEALSDVVAIAIPGSSSLALKSDGTVVAWGNNAYGQVTVPGSADLSGLSIDGTAVSPSFDPAVTAYTAYAGPSTAVANVTATLEDTVYTALYINHQMAVSGAETTVPLTGTTTDITIRTEPYLKTGKTYTITVLKDTTPPEVSFGTNGSETWSAVAASTVTVTDTEGGVDPASLQYAWSTGTALPASGWTSFASGETLIQSGSDGDWYLHIQAADIFGNTTHTVSSRFRLDNAASAISILSPQGANVSVSTSNIVLGFGEAVTGVANKKVTVSDGTELYHYTISASDNNISVTDSVYRATIPVTGFVIGTEPLSFKHDTAYTVAVEGGAYIDAAGNGIEPGTIGSFRTEKKTYTVTFKDWNEAVLSTQTVTEGSKAALPTSPVRGGYSFAGWYRDKAYTSIFDFDTPITADQTVYAKWRKVENNGGSSGNAGSGSRRSANVDLDGVTVAGNVVTAKVAVDSSGRAAAILTQGQIIEAINNALAVNGAEAVVEIRIEAPASMKAVDVSLSQAAMEAAAGSNMSTLVLTTPIGTLSFDAKALSSIAQQTASEVTFSISRVDTETLSEAMRELIGDRPIYEFSITSGGKPISQFDGEVMVSVPYNPTEEELEDPEHITIWYVDSNDRVVPVPSGRYDAQTGRVTFTTNHFSRYAVMFVKKTFNDLESTTWAKKQIEVLASKGIMEGRRDEDFMPAAGITRAEYLSALVRTLGVTAKTDDCFDDVAIGSQYYEEIAIAKKLGLTSGTGNNHFSPEATITRHDMMVLTERALRSMGRLSSIGTSADLDQFTDKADVKNYGMESIAALVKEGLISGSNGRLNVMADTTRAEAAVFLYKLYGR